MDEPLFAVLFIVLVTGLVAAGQRGLGGKVFLLAFGSFLVVVTLSASSSIGRWRDYIPDGLQRHVQGGNSSAALSKKPKTGSEVPAPGSGSPLTTRKPDDLVQMQCLHSGSELAEIAQSVLESYQTAGFSGLKGDIQTCYVRLDQVPTPALRKAVGTCLIMDGLGKVIDLSFARYALGPKAGPIDPYYLGAEWEDRIKSHLPDFSDADWHVSEKQILNCGAIATGYWSKLKNSQKV